MELTGTNSGEDLCFRSSGQVPAGRRGAVNERGSEAKGNHRRIILAAQFGTPRILSLTTMCICGSGKILSSGISLLRPDFKIAQL